MGTRTRDFGWWLIVGVIGCGEQSTPPTSPAPTTPTSSVSTPASSAPPATTHVEPTSTAPVVSSTSEPAPTSTPTAPGTETSSANTGDSGSEPPFIDTGKRELLSQTGLYSDMATETLGPRVKEYQPQFELWTDSAAKRRWIHIPEGTQIDATYMDEWQFPVGTKIWKEFSRDGVRVETRLIEKLPPERASEGFQGWFYMTYVWNDDNTDAAATVDGVQNAKGTPHDVPPQDACGDCHDMRREKPLGVSAVQLSHNKPGATLDSLFADGWLTNKPEVPLAVPGTAEEQQLLGYFHANCGHCHREGAPVNNRVSGLKLWLESTSLTSVQDTPAYRGLVNAFTESGQGSTLEYRVKPGEPDNSELMRRLLFRAHGDTSPAPVDENGEQVEVPMPPLGTEVIDEPAVERVRRWILSLPTEG